LGEPWAGRLKFISSESSFTHGGLIEGALEAAQRYAKETIGAGALSTGGERGAPTANRDWDWL
tara:strand:+ start:172 stop:360 length:189 start_codon:yes stop_codon:yes gene_type:complete